MLNFDFVSDEKFRFSLEKDYEELILSLQNGSWKAAYLLAGSIIEAILIDYLSATSYQQTDPLSMTLEEAIRACIDEDVLSEKASYIVYTMRSYRNLIHPVK